ncbi:acetyltransferase (GNAT) family protein [Kribbella orskensis]|uniref:Acetyltransferase (GNAT) family protein n=1 Tax=Kribbella orskensis TaxID=2512216 RepID=A0ABY2BJ86_9ACTN|nr:MULTISPECIES: GNAT family N-acetyltransferase [Kribbella]TCN39308.1 acetyltransferase (GNAT) family protein [Kribbella sp. VKM Ac-2500]TCO21955.1 acetyltransferase (GNAT) family protein [Kribbella orskensis]
MRLREITPEEVAELQELIESDPGYTERITGYPPGPADAQSLLMMRPEGLPEDAKVVLGAWEGDQLVAVIDLLNGYPDDRTAYIGLLEVHKNHQGRGVGAAAYRLLEEYLGSDWWRLRLAVVDTNAEQAAGFWSRQGFEPTGEAKPYTYDKLESTVRLYEKQLTWSHPGLEVRRSGIAGQGLFATKAISKGEVVSRLAGRKVSTAELRELLENPPVDTITLADDEHLVLPNDPRPTIAYGNHSCDPNLWWIDAVTLEACRDIAPGEEITSDYGTSTGTDFEMACNCGSSLCRGKITGEDWQREELRARYGDHWIPALLNRIRG